MHLIAELKLVVELFAAFLLGAVLSYAGVKLGLIK
jgi:hypothetical protein